MIFYFTGTGNSGYIATELAKNTNDEIISIPELINNNERLEFTLKDNENIGFIFPIYAWAPPSMVIKFIEDIKFNNIRDNYIFAVATCGANIGNGMKMIEKSLKDNNLYLNSGFSIAMPNNYIIMGDVDSKEEENEKLKEAKKKASEISNVINNKEKNVFQVKKGFLGGALTSIVSPMFNKYAMDTSKFFVTDKCTGCGICSKVCTCNNIKLDSKKPIWGEKCSQCLACIHSCPVRAIEYGKSTANKGRYVNPYFRKY